LWIPSGLPSNDGANNILTATGREYCGTAPSSCTWCCSIGRIDSPSQTPQLSGARSVQRSVAVGCGQKQKSHEPLFRGRGCTLSSDTRFRWNPAGWLESDQEQTVADTLVVDLGTGDGLAETFPVRMHTVQSRPAERQNSNPLPLRVSTIGSARSGLSFFTLPTSGPTFQAFMKSASNGRSRSTGGRSGSPGSNHLP